MKADARPAVAEPHPAFASAAVQALEDWRFAAPSGTAAAIVRMQQEFVFQNGS
jgi:hypothetical protein